MKSLCKLPCKRNDVSKRFEISNRFDSLSSLLLAGSHVNVLSEISVLLVLVYSVIVFIKISHFALISYLISYYINKIFLAKKYRTWLSLKLKLVLSELGSYFL